eukprot:2702913-Pyramimonas_sp.AAC.1
MLSEVGRASRAHRVVAAGLGLVGLNVVIVVVRQRRALPLLLEPVQRHMLAPVVCQGSGPTHTFRCVCFRLLPVASDGFDRLAQSLTGFRRARRRDARDSRRAFTHALLAPAAPKTESQ